MSIWGKIKSFFGRGAVEKSSCVHKYELLKKQEREIDLTYGRGRSILVEDVYIYCPKCRNRQMVTPLEWELIQKEQKLDAVYMEKHEIQHI